jgi:hypothetical protein
MFCFYTKESTGRSNKVDERREDSELCQKSCMIFQRELIPYIIFTISLQQSSHMGWASQYVGPTPFEIAIVNLL